CWEHYGAGEAYLPVLDAFVQLCREQDDKQLIETLSRHAPTWLVQMPALMNAADFEALQRKVLGATRERMLREIAEAIEALSVERPLILVLEDLHWSDPSTLDFITYLAQRREPARLLLIGTYRPAELLLTSQPLRSVVQELLTHRRCEEFPLQFL